MTLKLNEPACEAIMQKLRFTSPMQVQFLKAIDKQMGEIIYGYSSPVRDLIRGHVNECIKEVLNTSYREKIVAIFAEKLTSEHVETIVSASVDKAIEMLKDAGYSG
jgi:hypothetical protein